MSMRTQACFSLLVMIVAIMVVGCGRSEGSWQTVLGDQDHTDDRTQGVPYSVPADRNAEYEVLLNEDLGDPLGIGEQRRLFLSLRTSGASAQRLREAGLSRRSYAFRVVWCQPEKAASYIGAPEGLTGFDDSVRPSDAQIAQARKIARSIRISDIGGNPRALVPGSSTTVAVDVACSGLG